MTDTPEDSPVVITALGVQTNQFNELLAKDDFSAAIEVCEQMLKDMEPEQKHWRDLREQAQMARTRADHIASVERQWEELDLRIELMTKHHEAYLEELRAEYGRGLENHLYGWNTRGDEEYLCTERHMVRSSGYIDFCGLMTDEAERMHLHWAMGKHGPEEKSYLDLYPKFHAIFSPGRKIHRPGHKHAGDIAGEPMYYINDKLVFPNRHTFRHHYNLCASCYPRKNKCEEHMIPKGLDGNCGACVAFFTG
jgi:hypothetical protein